MHTATRSLGRVAVCIEFPPSDRVKQGAPQRHDNKTPSSYLVFNSRSSSAIETGKRRRRALRAHRRGLLLLLEPLEELDARLGGLGLLSPGVMLRCAQASESRPRW